MQTTKELARIYSGPSNLMRMLGAFDIEDPNRRHECLVLELLGPSVEEAGETGSSERSLSQLQSKLCLVLTLCAGRELGMR